MKKKVLVMFLAALIILSMALFGCKGKVEKVQEEPKLETPEAISPAEEAISMTEPAQTVATETIPPTAAPQIVEKPMTAVKQEKQNRDKDIQRALKNANFYTGAIDGKIGPKTKKAIEEFQKARGLKPDGKIGPKTWAELEKYLVQQ